MNIYDLKKQATQGPFWIDDDGFVAAGYGDNYVTFANFYCNDRDIDEQETNKVLVACCLNYFMPLLEALDAVLHVAETPGDMTEVEIMDILWDANELIVRIKELE